MWVILVHQSSMTYRCTFNLIFFLCWNVKKKKLKYEVSNVIGNSPMVDGFTCFEVQTTKPRRIVCRFKRKEPIPQTLVLNEWQFQFVNNRNFSNLLSNSILNTISNVSCKQAESFYEKIFNSILTTDSF